MLALELFKSPAFAKPFLRLVTESSLSASFRVARTTPPATTASRAFHQQLPIRTPLRRPRNLPPISIRNHVFPRPFSAKPFLRQQQQHQQQQRYGYNPGNERRGRGFNLGLGGGGYKPIMILAGGGATVFYFSNLETVPVSGRRRFNCFSEASAEQQGEMAYKKIIAQGRADGKLLDEFDSRVVMVKRVLERLLEGGGQDLGRVAWEVNVLDSDEANAFVLPGGKVFVFTEILKIAQNDAGLAAILGHEIAHNLANHSAERMSSAIVVQLLIYLAGIAEYAFFGGNGQISHFLAQMALDFGVMRPASREQESEADYIGLLLMAQSCYDPSAAVGMWERMEMAQKMAPPEWLSTHPSNESRIAHIKQWLPKAEEKRSEAGCSFTAGYAADFQKVVGSFF